MSSSPLSPSSLCCASCSCLKVNASRSQTHWRRARVSAGRLSSCPSPTETTCRYSAPGRLCRSITQTTIPAWSLPPGGCWLKIICPIGSLCQLTLLCCQIVNHRAKRMRHWEKLCPNFQILLILHYRLGLSFLLTPLTDRLPSSLNELLCESLAGHNSPSEPSLAWMQCTSEQRLQVCQYVSLWVFYLTLEGYFLIF